MMAYPSGQCQRLTHELSKGFNLMDLPIALGKIPPVSLSVESYLTNVDARQGLGVNDKPHIIIRTTSFPCVTVRKSICIKLLNLVTRLTHVPIHSAALGAVTSLSRQ